MGLSGLRLRKSFVLQYIILICLFFFSRTIVYTALILKRMVLFYTVKSINEYLCKKTIIYITLPLIYALGFSIFVVEKLGKKISPNVLEYDGNIRNNWNESYLKRTFFWRLRLIFIWQVLWYSFGEDKLHRKISEDCERIFICTKTLCLSFLALISSQ